MPRRACITAACGVFLAAATAQAADHPPLMPTRDAAVTYHVSGATHGGEKDATVRMYFKAGGNLMRINTPGNRGYAIIDRKNKLMYMVIDAQRMYMELPAGDIGDRAFMLTDSMQFKRKGSGSVAGYSCTVWSVQADDGSGTACITDDGVMLRASGRSKSGKRQGRLQAIAVDFAPQPASLFAPPTDYRKMEVPAAPGGSQAPAQSQQQQPQQEKQQ